MLVIVHITLSFIVCEQLSVIYKPEWIQINKWPNMKSTSLSVRPPGACHRLKIHFAWACQQQIPWSHVIISPLTPTLISLCNNLYTDKPVNSHNGDPAEFAAVAMKRNHGNNLGFRSVRVCLSCCLFLSLCDSVSARSPVASWWPGDAKAHWGRR